MSDDKLLKDIVDSLIEERKSDKKFKFLTRSIFFVFILILVVSITLSTTGNINQTNKHVAVVEITGMISSAGPVNPDVILPHIQNAAKNDKCVGIILKINSPGGSATQSKIIFDEIKKIRLTTDKKIYAVIDDVGASGGYYIAASADKIFSSSSSIVGSIGVRLDSFNVSRLMDKLGVDSQTLSSGKDKTMLDPFSPLTPKHRIHLERLLKNIHNQFIQDIESSRGDKITQDVFTGLFWTGIEAKRIGLIDDLLSTYDVSEKFFNNNPLIVYNKEKDIVKELLNSTLNTSNTIFGIKY